jgi:hypothetical protein
VVVDCAFAHSIITRFQVDMALAAPAYLNSLQSNIRPRPVRCLTAHVQLHTNACRYRGMVLSEPEISLMIN